MAHQSDERIALGVQRQPMVHVIARPLKEVIRQPTVVPEINGRTMSAKAYESIYIYI